MGLNPVPSQRCLPVGGGVARVELGQAGPHAVEDPGLDVDEAQSGPRGVDQDGLPCLGGRGVPRVVPRPVGGCAQHLRGHGPARDGHWAGRVG
ncbi:hypothetical protein ACFFX0_32530 [Citricoccus parietis]|uniref:Uncharacterized protein n=1 Tax=Citricoccus parietis TaxID=592307 RepID=A0ABV5G9L9_9MICC